MTGLHQPIHTLHEFISLLEADGELSRISVSVDPVLEIAAITDRICKQPGGGSALLLEHPAGSPFPVATNLFGSPARGCRIPLQEVKSSVDTAALVARRWKEYQL
jgi:UbiD family decarboxylase